MTPLAHQRDDAGARPDRDVVHPAGLADAHAESAGRSRKPAAMPGAPDPAAGGRKPSVWYAGMVLSFAAHAAVIAGLVGFRSQPPEALAAGGAPMEVELVVGTLDSAAADAAPADRSRAKSSADPAPAPDLAVPLPPQIEPPMMETNDPHAQAMAKQALVQSVPAPVVAVPLPPAAALEGLAPSGAPAHVETKRAPEPARLQAERRKRREQARGEAALRRQDAKLKKMREERLRARQQEVLRKKRIEEAQKRRPMRDGKGRASQSTAAASRGGSGGAAHTAGQASRATHRASVLAHLARFKRYPAAARDQGVTGRAIVMFRVTPQGGIAGVSLARSSGSALLDRATLDMVRRAVPFPQGPAAL